MNNNTHSPIQININNSPVRTCDNWFQVVGYAIGCWLRQHWPFDRRHSTDRLILELITMLPDNVTLTAPCGCKLIVMADLSHWAVQAPCKPSVWTDYDHQLAAAVSIGLTENAQPQTV